VPAAQQARAWNPLHNAELTDNMYGNHVPDCGDMLQATSPVCPPSHPRLDSRGRIISTESPLRRPTTAINLCCRPQRLGSRLVNPPMMRGLVNSMVHVLPPWKGPMGPCLHDFHPLPSSLNAVPSNAYSSVRQCSGAWEGADGGPWVYSRGRRPEFSELSSFVLVAVHSPLSPSTWHYQQSTMNSW